MRRAPNAHENNEETRCATPLRVPKEPTDSKMLELLTGKLILRRLDAKSYWRYRGIMAIADLVMLDAHVYELSI